MLPLQCIQLEAHAVKGTGREHTKWSPVATAWYRLQPEVVLLQPVTGAAAQVRCLVRSITLQFIAALVFAAACLCKSTVNSNRSWCNSARIALAKA